jgi:hypothetical protein
MYFIDSLEDGYEQLRDLVISYLGLEDDRLDAPRPITSDEIKRFDDFDIQRSGSINSFFFSSYYYYFSQLNRFIFTINQCNWLSKFFSSIS